LHDLKKLLFYQVLQRHS